MISFSRSFRRQESRIVLLLPRRSFANTSKKGSGEIGTYEEGTAQNSDVVVNDNQQSFVRFISTSARPVQPIPKKRYERYVQTFDSLYRLAKISLHGHRVLPEDTETPLWMQTSQQRQAIPWCNMLELWLRRGIPKYFIPAVDGDVQNLEMFDLKDILYKLQAGEKIDPGERKWVLKQLKSASVTESLQTAIRLRDPYESFAALVKSSSVRSYGPSPLIQLLPNTFSEVLRIIDPTHFLARHGELRKEFSPHYSRVLRIGSIDANGFYQFYAKFLEHIYEIFEARRRLIPPPPPSLSDFKIILKAARLTGNTAIADSTWQVLYSNRWQIAPGRRILPDTECFNLYLATICWSDVKNPLYAHRLRIMPYNIEPRQWERIPRTHVGHRVGEESGIKFQVSRLIRQMSELGLVGDEQTFCSLMVASAREGDLSTVETLLQRVWNIDVQKVISGDESTNYSNIQKYSPDSPLYPSQELFHTLAHIYGINNSIPTALQLIDHISELFSIKISSQVWDELLQWTHVLATERYGLHAENRNTEGSTEGQLPIEAVSSLWRTMTSEPYNIQPTMRMYDFLIGNLINRDRYTEVKARMKEARILHIKSVRRLSKEKLLFENNLRRKGYLPTTEVHERNYNFQLLRVRRNRQYIRKWFGHLIRRGSKEMVDNVSWTCQEVPRLIEDWKPFTDRTVDYRTATGFVRLHTGTRAENKLRIWRIYNRNSVTKRTGLFRRRIRPSTDWKIYEIKQQQIESSQ